MAWSFKTKRPRLNWSPEERWSGRVWAFRNLPSKARRAPGWPALRWLEILTEPELPRPKQRPWRFLSGGRMCVRLPSLYFLQFINCTRLIEAPGGKVERERVVACVLSPWRLVVHHKGWSTVTEGSAGLSRRMIRDVRAIMRRTRTNLFLAARFSVVRNRTDRDGIPERRQSFPFVCRRPFSGNQSKGGWLKKGKGRAWCFFRPIRKEVRMKHTEANMIVSNDWSGIYPAGSRLNEALAVLGMSRETYDRLRCKAKGAERRFPRRLISTPIGSGRHR